MTTINAGGAFYRVQNSLDQNSSRVSDSMQRLASGKQNIAPGDRTASSAVAFGMKAELASLKVGIQNGTEALNAIEMITNDIAALNDMVVRLEELNALGENGFNSGADTAALAAEAGKIITEFEAVQTRATWKGNDIFGGSNSVAFGRNTDAVDITLTGISDLDSVATHVTAANVSEWRRGCCICWYRTTTVLISSSDKWTRCRLMLGPSIIRFPTRLTTYQV